MFTGNIPAGVSKQSIAVNVGNNVSDDERRICQDRTITVTVTADADCLSGLSVREISCPVIYIAGSADTMSSFHLPEGCSDTWKQMLTTYIGHKAAISDYSRPGLTTESFRKEGQCAAIYEYSRPGDFCLFQFDPSGQPVEDWASGGICRRQLARYIMECRERFMYPVLLTPVYCHKGRNMDDFTGQLWKQCLEAYREVGKLTATPVIELHKLCVTTHDEYVTAESVAKEIALTCGAHPGRGYRFLAKCMG
ncbi:MAG: hypothetical protein NC121_00810 [Blautia sp.]|nr:hypothetical protein [Blautia sp.]